MLALCPRCNQRVVSDDSNTDVIHECNSGVEALDNEDIVNITAANANFQGLQDKSGGAKIGLIGNDLEKLTSRGNRISTHTSRQHSEFIEMKRC
jgi:hypothetical protein